MDIEFPWRRDELVEHLKRLSDLQYQRQAWIYQHFPPGIQFDEPTLYINFLYDDTGLAEDTDGMVGLLLKNQEEAEAIKKLIRRFDVVLDQYDIGYIPPSEFLGSRAWFAVVEAAKEALPVFT
jgi:hypothetical protein